MDVMATTEKKVTTADEEKRKHRIRGKQESGMD